MKQSDFGFLMSNMFVAVYGNVYVCLVLCVFWVIYGVVYHRLEKKTKVFYDYTILEDGGKMGNGTIIRSERFTGHKDKQSATALILEERNLDNAVVEFRLI